MIKKEFIIHQDTNLNQLSREIISYFTTNDNFEDKLADDDTDESRLFTLAVKYLDAELTDEKDEIAQQLKNFFLSCIAQPISWRARL